MRIGSFGVIFVFFLIVFIVGVGVVALMNTDYTIGTNEEANETDWNSNMRTIVLWNVNFSPLAGILCTGYFLHTCSLPILRSSKNPENNTRDLFWGYFLVMISYVICGCLGYIGFTGINYASYFIVNPPVPNNIDQNCLNMFDYRSVPAFILRLSIFMLLFSTYPLMHYFMNNLLLNLFWKNSTISKKAELLLTISITTVPLLFSLFYPNVGTVLAYTGALSGFLIVYILPVMVYLKMLKTKITNPILAEAIH
jgi:solute carrier family 38 (sodium-coupled neutral amino acid transporter), member 9